MIKYGSKLQFEAPDKCPIDCAYYHDIRNYGQNATCFRCPVLNCEKQKIDNDNDLEYMVPPKDFRDDWGIQWDTFFKTGESPILKIYYEESK